jgi:ligand-binding sensor domain-containing protein
VGNSPLPSNNILALSLGRQGDIWIGTDRGAAGYLPRSKSWTILRDQLGYVISRETLHVVTALVEAKDKSLWIGLRGGGVVRYNPNSSQGKHWTRFVDEISYPVVAAVVADVSNELPYGEVWVSTYFGLSRFHQIDQDLGSWTDYTGAFPVDRLLAARSNPADNHLWFGAQAGGMVEIYYDVTLRHNDYPFTVLDSRINAIAFEGTQYVWVAKTNGAARLDRESGTWKNYTADSTGGGIPARSSVLSVASSWFSPSIWFGTESGLVQLHDSAWTHFTTLNSPLPNDTATALEIDVFGNLWIGTRHGLAIYNPDGTRF